MGKFHLHSVTDASVCWQQPCRGDCCYVAEIIVDVPFSDLLQDILLLLSKLPSKRWKAGFCCINYITYSILVKIFIRIGTLPRQHTCLKDVKKISFKHACCLGLESTSFLIFFIYVNFETFWKIRKISIRIYFVIPLMSLQKLNLWRKPGLFYELSPSVILI